MQNETTRVVRDFIRDANPMDNQRDTNKTAERVITMGFGSRITFRYMNWRGEPSQRCVETYRVYWGTTEWHPEPGWILAAFDLDKREHRQFAMKDMGNVEPA